MTSQISVKNLTKTFQQYKKQPGLSGALKSFIKREYFDIKAVNNISFEINKGEKVGFIGSNGAGKTTTLKMLSGILNPTSGTIEIEGFTPLKRNKEFLRKISLVMGQKSQLMWDLPPMDTYKLNKEIYKVSNKDFDIKINELVDILELKDVINIPTRKLSLGQRMKSELLASLIHSPEIIFLDEPTIGLDVLIQKKIRNFFKDYNKRFKTTLILTSHYMDDVKELCDRVIIIDKGVIIFDGSIQSVTSRFAENKYLKLIFNSQIEKSDLKQFGKIIKFGQDSLSATISVDRKDHTKIAASILKKFPIDDLDISEITLEEIIAKILSSAN